MAVRAVPVQLGGQERQLRFALAGWAALEDHGYELAQVLQDLGAAKKKAVGVLAWAMLQEEDPPPALREVFGWIDGENFVTVALQVGAALRLSFPANGTAPPGPPPAVPAARGTGTRPKSSPSGR